MSLSHTWWKITKLNKRLSELIIFAANPGIPKGKLSLLKNAWGRVTTSKRMKKGKCQWLIMTKHRWRFDYVVFTGLITFWVMNKHLGCTQIDHQMYMCDCKNKHIRINCSYRYISIPSFCLINSMPNHTRICFFRGAIRYIWLREQ